MARDDLTSVDGKITGLTGGGRFTIDLENGHNVTAKLCGKMRRFKIKCVVGDRVTVGISPYDIDHGLILHRHKF